MQQLGAVVRPDPEAGQPDLEITDADVGSQDISFAEFVNDAFAPGDTVPLTVEVTNTGDGDAPSSRAAVYLVVDGENILMDTNSSGSLDAGESNDNENLSFELPSNLEAGTYSVIVVADYLNDVDESDESNNAFGFFITVEDAGEPDLEITDVDVGSQDISLGELVNATFLPGDTVPLTVEVTNTGDGDAPSSRAAVYLVVDGENILMDTNSSGSLDAGESNDNENLSFELPSNLEPGTYSVIVVADYLNDVDESDESNNGTGFFITVEDAGEPDLVITDTEVDGQTIDLGDTVNGLYGAGDNFSVTIDIRNIGDGDAPGSASAVYLVVDGENILVDTNTTNALDAGSTDPNETLSFVIPANIAAGVYSVLVVSDFRNDVDESDELNNGTAFLVNLADDYADELGETGTINGVGILGVGGSIGGWIGLNDSDDDTFGDRDAFIVSLVEGRTYTFVVDGSDGLTDAIFSIRDSSFDRVGELSSEGDPATLTFVAPYSGNFFVRVGTGVSGQTGSYSLSVTEEQAPDLEFSEVAVGNQILNLGDTVAGTFTPGETVDVDVDITNAGNADAQSSVAAVYLVIDDEPLLLATNPTNPLAAGSTDVSESLSFVIPTDLNAGTFSVIVVTDYLNNVDESDEDNNATGFFITVGGEVSDDFADQPGDGGTANGVGSLSVGQTISGVIGPADGDDTYGDKDVFLVSLEAGQTYRIELVAQDLPLGIFTIRDPDDFSNVLQVSRIGSTTSTEFTVDVSGDYWIRVGTGGEPTDQGSYELSVENISSGQSDDPTEPDPPADDYADTPSDGGSVNGIPTLNLGNSIIGSIEIAGDKDVIAVELVAGRTYQFSVVGEARGAEGALQSLFITIRNPDDFHEIEDQGSGLAQAVVTFEAEDTGTFFVRIGAGSAGGSGGYRLTVADLGDTAPNDTGGGDPPVDVVDEATAELLEILTKSVLNLASPETWQALVAVTVKMDDVEFERFARKIVDLEIGGTIPVLDASDVGLDVLFAVQSAPEGQGAREGIGQLFESLFEAAAGFVGARAGSILGAAAGSLGGVTGGVVGYWAGAAIGGILASEVFYTEGLREQARELGYFLYDTASAALSQSEQAQAEIGFDLDEAEIVRLDEAWYLETYPDAREALENGTAGSAYAHFLAIGVDLGYQPNEAQSIARAELAGQLTDNNPLALGNSAILTLDLGDYAGDGTSSAELAVANAFNTARGAIGNLDLDASLTAFASRKANDLVANFSDSAINFAFFEGNSAWAQAWSNGNLLSQQFRGMLEELLGEGVDSSRYSLFAVSSQFGDPEDVLARLQAQEGFNAAFENSDFDTIGIAEFGGLWVVILADREPDYQIESPGEDTLASTSQFGSDEFDVLFGGLRSSTLYGFDGDDLLFGSNEADLLIGGLGNDGFSGGANVDTVLVSGSRSEYTVTQRENGGFDLVGPDGMDSLVNVEFVQFDDELLRLLPGQGVSVDFSSTDPADYAAAMEMIRDFDGNDLGGDGAWLHIGSIDINGDGDVDHVLVNDAIGRFATVGTGPDGLVYFDDHSWAGETRVVGIYIDPLVESGEVVAGSDHDSQRRFQNDLQIENINGILGADDYDGDGEWEVYFSLTDGTAYLRAIMHEDGNIRYANYQSEAQVRDYLTSNGYDETTFGDWFNNGSQGATDTATFVFRPDDDEKQADQAPESLDFAALAAATNPSGSDIEMLFASRPVENQFRPFDEIQAEFFG